VTAAPEPLAPPTVEHLFLAAVNGPSPIPAPRLDSSTLADIRSFLRRYTVGTVAVEPIGRNPQLVLRYLRAALGRPPRLEGGLDLWFDADGLSGADRMRRPS
jgi:hypothetical protein